MQLTDLFIKRPVLASVISLMILLLGLQAINSLAVRQYPALKNTVITVQTTYPGATADLMQGFITVPIEQAIASAEGLDYMTSVSQQSTSTISAYVKLNGDPSAAMTEVMSKVQQVKYLLPKEANDPIITKQTGDPFALMYIGFNSPKMTPQQITDYLTRVIQPKLQTIGGVASAQILGGQTFAMRIWLNPQKMAAEGVSPQDISAALAANNFQSAAGQVKGVNTAININADTGTATPDEFRRLVIATRGTTLIRLEDVAEVELGPQSTDSTVIFDGEKAVFIGIYGTPSANPLNVITDVRAAMPGLQAQLPPSMTAKVVYDSTTYIRASIREVATTILEAAGIVIVVIFLFLGAFRSVIIPVVTIPLSLIGACFLMLVLGYSINLLTLLAMVLAIGLVVDDAIVVLENIHRHIEDGLTPLQAALQGAREIAGPVVAMTITLAAVYAPIGFTSGLTGALFKEFAFTLAGAVVVSGVIALTLTPMMCSRLLNRETLEGRLARMINRGFERLRIAYERRLAATLNYRALVLLFAAVVLGSCFFLFMTTQRELAPTEDQGAIFVQAKSPQYANLDYLDAYIDKFGTIFRSFPEMGDYFIVDGSGGVNTSFAGMILKPWAERPRTQDQILPGFQHQLDGIAGLKVFAFPLPALPGNSGGLPVQFVINTTADYEQLFQVMSKLQEAATKSGQFIVVDSDLKFDNPELEVNIDRGKAAELGIRMDDIGSALATMLGGNYVNWFSLQGRSYQVIPEMPRNFRLNPHALDEIQVRTVGGALIQLSTVASLKVKVKANALTQFNQLNSATISALPMPGRTIGDGLTFLQDEAAKLFPEGFTYDYEGASRQYIQEGNTFVFTLFFALIVIYLVLAAQFESFRDPLIILVSVPMSICGALIPLNLGAATINIYTLVGLVTLVGLISKHGILLVEFANQLQRQEGLSKREAIERAAGIRLRPILMTTASMVVGVVPLLVAAGAGARSRFDIGLVIFSGMSIGTLFTLFIVPTIYILLAGDHRTTVPRPVARHLVPEIAE